MVFGFCLFVIVTILSSSLYVICIFISQYFDYGSVIVNLLDDLRKLWGLHKVGEIGIKT